MNELASITTEELGLLLEELHEPKFRTSQVMKWLAKGVPPKEMLNIPKTLREKLSAFPFGGVGIIECKQSKKDDTAHSLIFFSPCRWQMTSIRLTKRSNLATIASKVFLSIDTISIFSFF